MKKVLVFISLFAAIAIGLIYGCSKEKNAIQRATSVDASSTASTQKERPIHVEGYLTWRGLFGSDRCQGEPCGACFGVCLIVEWVLADGTITEEERAHGKESFELSFEDEKLLLTSDGRTMDNGDGLCRIDADYPVSNEVAHELGVDGTLTVLAGEYEVDHSDPEHPAVRFNYRITE